MTDNTNICCYCKGSGLSNEKPQLCPHGKCEKCENNECYHSISNNSLVP